ncbi:DUF2946 domain-containing protein [Pseudomonas ovata]|uniref:DUF2946 domain-containing protein n=1 Tax=Pseudomonas ovata TaxID=1839709 RepID=UPI00137997D7|nr:DUF2946 domain-containing protein [Pseudomonas ovata]
MSAPRPGRAGTTRPRPRRGTWLSLFAMLMIFIGPLISQSMPMEHHAGTPMPTAHHAPVAAGADHTHHANAHDAHAAQATTDASRAAMDHALWAKCGYCTLLFGCPALPQVLAMVAITPPKPSAFYVALTRAGHARHTVFLHALSRAPPLSTLS